MALRRGLTSKSTVINGGTSLPCATRSEHWRKNKNKKNGETKNKKQKKNESSTRIPDSKQEKRDLLISPGPWTLMDGAARLHRSRRRNNHIDNGDGNGNGNVNVNDDGTKGINNNRSKASKKISIFLPWPRSDTFVFI